MNKTFVALAALMLAATPAAAQVKITVNHTPTGYLMRVEDQYGVRPRLIPSVPHILEDFVEKTRPGSGSNYLAALTAHRDLFPTATVDSVANGLEHLARTHPDDHVGVAALYSLGALGDAKGSIRRGHVTRLVSIYGAANARRRSAVVDVLGQAGETRAAAAFLRSVAVGDTTGPDGRLPKQAVFSLSVLGPDGVATLRELHQRGLVKEQDARMLLGGLSRQGFDSRRKP